MSELVLCVIASAQIIASQEKVEKFQLTGNGSDVRTTHHGNQNTTNGTEYTTPYVTYGDTDKGGIVTIKHIDLVIGIPALCVLSIILCITVYVLWGRCRHIKRARQHKGPSRRQTTDKLTSKSTTHNFNKTLRGGRSLPTDIGHRSHHFDLSLARSGNAKRLFSGRSEPSLRRLQKSKSRTKSLFGRLERTKERPEPLESSEDYSKDFPILKDVDCVVGDLVVIRRGSETLLIPSRTHRAVASSLSDTRTPEETGTSSRAQGHSGRETNTQSKVINYSTDTETESDSGSKEIGEDSQSTWIREDSQSTGIRKDSRSKVTEDYSTGIGNKDDSASKENTDGNESDRSQEISMSEWVAEFRKEMQNSSAKTPSKPKI